jgi:hypothetical protein
MVPFMDRTQWGRLTRAAATRRGLQEAGITITKANINTVFLNILA